MCILPLVYALFSKYPGLTFVDFQIAAFLPKSDRKSAVEEGVNGLGNRLAEGMMAGDSNGQPKKNSGFAGMI